MPTSTLARRIPLQSLAITPLLAAALLVGTGSAPTSSVTHQAAPSAGTAPVTIKAKPVAYVSAAVRAARGRTAVKVAAAQQGDPYRYGAAGPSAFDCSGLVYYTYRTRLGVGVPRTANAQRLASVRISKSNLQQGDLIFFMSGGRAYHVGIYAGYGKVWHSPKPGQRVQLSRIWTTSWVAGRMP
ncbi:C40 family peptidase [Terrabacter sp. LjRoot27]|uniref:C40 family peptidase n=1 Tax=Terrabacter sp. LjRoot27 TaxID=3342306 RepID=UPI003F4FBA62